MPYTFNVLAKVLTGTTIGLDGVLIDVEVDVANRGFPAFNLVGLPSKAVEEARDRVRTAIINTSFDMPDSRITVNLAPADIPKSGSGFDLPIAVGVLASSGLLQKKILSSSLFAGELSLMGNIKPVPGIISIALLARKKRIEQLFVPAGSAREAAMVEGITVYAVTSLSQLVLHINGQAPLSPYPSVPTDNLYHEGICNSDFADVRGQLQAKRALEIAAAGFHNVHLKGVPGTGKTLLSRSFASILPPLSREEILDVSRIYSVVGLLGEKGYIENRPYRSPHHTTSRIGLIGGGSNPAPGEISLAHRGVLFLDELPEFPRSTLESLRQPLEDGFVTISRASGSMRFPCRFLLIAASNPCQCGYWGHPTRKCTCMPGAIHKYRKKLSGPLLDRIDLHVNVPPVKEDRLISPIKEESSVLVRQRVIKALKHQTKRFAGTGIRMNGEMSPKEIRNLCRLTEKASDLLKTAISRFTLSARSYFKIIKVSQTIADLEDKNVIEITHIAEALQYRAAAEN